LNKNQKILSPTKNTPEVILDPKGIIILTGRLIPENAEDFFNPIEEWINDYFKNPADITIVEIHLEYINSVGIRFLLNIIHKITHIYLQKNTKKFAMEWYYKEEDEDMLEKGRYFSSDLDIPFSFIKII
jgi:SiaC family regulatory phosphoprotein